MLTIEITRYKRTDGGVLVRKEASATTKYPQQVAFGAVYLPEVTDSQGDWMNADEIRKSAYDLMRRGATGDIDVRHNNRRVDASVVESFVARKGDPDFKIPGSWIVGIEFRDADVWAEVEKGELGGLSMEALAQRHLNVSNPTVRKNYAFPGTAIGSTFDADDHHHTYEAVFDTEGNLVGGRTNIVKDSQGRPHRHEIKKGVITEAAEHGRHRFASIDHFLEAA